MRRRPVYLALFVVVLTSCAQQPAPISAPIPVPASAPCPACTCRCAGQHMESSHAQISPAKQTEIDRDLRAAQQLLQGVGK